VVEMIDVARARTTQNLLFVNREDGSSRSALYNDEVVRTPEGWRIAKRRCQFIVADGLSDRPSN